MSLADNHDAGSENVLGLPYTTTSQLVYDLRGIRHDKPMHRRTKSRAKLHGMFSLQNGSCTSLVSTATSFSSHSLAGDMGTHESIRPDIKRSQRMFALNQTSSSISVASNAKHAADVQLSIREDENERATKPSSLQHELDAGKNEFHSALQKESSFPQTLFRSFSLRSGKTDVTKQKQCVAQKERLAESTETSEKDHLTTDTTTASPYAEIGNLARNKSISALWSRVREKAKAVVNQRKCHTDTIYHEKSAFEKTLPEQFHNSNTFLSTLRTTNRVSRIGVGNQGYAGIYIERERCKCLSPDRILGSRLSKNIFAVHRTVPLVPHPYVTQVRSEIEIEEDFMQERISSHLYVDDHSKIAAWI